VTGVPIERRITDPDTLKALTHPLRQRLFRLLAQLGPATTTILAGHLAADPGQISYHLRELAKRGFIEEAPELARDRRERWYRIPEGPMSWSSGDFVTPEARAVFDAAFAQSVADQFERLRGYNEVKRSWSEDWQGAVTASNSEIRLTAAELRALAAELNEVIRRYAAPGRHDPAVRPEDRPDDGRENVFLFFHAFPERP
jgi:DNA-binding transcriptional ArsR family regulator